MPSPPLAPTTTTTIGSNPKKRVVIFDFDGTLFDTHTSIVHSISRTFATLLGSSSSLPSSASSSSLGPGSSGGSGDGQDGGIGKTPTQAPAAATATALPLPSDEQIHEFIARGTGLRDTFTALRLLVGLSSSSSSSSSTPPLPPHSSTYPSSHPSPPSQIPAPAPALAPTEEILLWESTYRAIYATEGQALIRPFSGATSLLRTLKQEHPGISMAIVSNKGIVAVTTALDNAGLTGVVPEDLIVGDTTPGAERKPGPGSYLNVLRPRLRDRYGVYGVHGVHGEGGEDGKEGMERMEGKALKSSGDVWVVGDTVADLRFAANIGATSVWCRYGYGDKEACERLDPTYIADSLEEVLALITMS